MQTHCSPNQFSFQAFNGRSVSSSFDGGHITSDSGGLLLREIEEGQQFIQSGVDPISWTCRPLDKEHEPCHEQSLRMRRSCASGF